MEKTCEPQGHTCTGPRPRRSVPNLSGNLGLNLALNLALNFGSLGRRRTRVTFRLPPFARPLKGRLFCFCSLTLAIIAPSTNVANATRQ